MKNTFKDHMLLSGTKIWQFAITSVFVLAIAGCGEVDENDGLVVTEINLPMDSVLTLYCPDAGIADEPCILDDPENPYAISPVLADDPEAVVEDEEDRPLIKWRLSEEAPSAKASFYLWATVQAMEPMGENQYHVARALHEMYGESGSALAKEQALKAYRSVLDNYFNSATFFEADWVGGDDIYYPFPVRKLVGQNMHNPGAPLTSLFDDPAEALEIFGEWGYTYDDQITLDFTHNY